MKKQSIYFISNGKKVLVEKNIYFTTLTDSKGAIFYKYVSVERWEQFKKSHPNYTDDDIAYCLAHELIPSQMAQVGNFIVETIE